MSTATWNLPAILRPSRLAQPLRRSVRHLRRSGHPGAYFTYDLVVTALLAYLAIGNAAAPRWSTWPFGWPEFSFERVIPLWVPWGGALGGVTISLVGVATYAHVWDSRRYRWWHLSRPLLGSVSGTFAVLIIVFVLQSVAPDVTNQEFSARGTAVLTAIGFVVGYREETFRELIKRVVDLVLQPAPVAATSTRTLAFVPGDVDFGPVGVGSTATRVAHLYNGGTATVSVSARSVSPVVAGLTCSAADAELGPHQSWELTLGWAPSAAGPLREVLRLSAGEEVILLPVTGTAS